MPTNCKLSVHVKEMLSIRLREFVCVGVCGCASSLCVHVIVLVRRTCVGCVQVSRLEATTTNIKYENSAEKETQQTRRPKEQAPASTTTKEKQTADHPGIPARNVECVVLCYVVFGPMPIIFLCCHVV